MSNAPFPLVLFTRTLIWDLFYDSVGTGECLLLVYRKFALTHNLASYRNRAHYVICVKA